MDEIAQNKEKKKALELCIRSPNTDTEKHNITGEKQADHSVHPPFLPVGEKGLILWPNFQKRGAWQDLNLQRELLGKRGLTFFFGEVALFK